MHSLKQIENIVRGIDAVMVLGVGNLTGYAQAALETDAIAVYLATQIATLRDDEERDKAIREITDHVTEAVRVRVAALAA